MSEHFSVYSAHKEIIKRMQQLGYMSNSTGVCFGVAAMAMQANLLGETEKFYSRIQKILGMSEEEFEPGAFFAKLKDSDKTTKQEYIDILAFFDGIEIYFQPSKHKELFGEETFYDKEQSIAKTSSLLLPERLGGLSGINMVHNLSGSYSLDDLKLKLSQLSATFKKCNAPVSMVLKISNHAICVGFDPEKDPTWFFADANSLDKITSATSIEELTKQIFTAFHIPLDNYAVIGAEIYTSKDNELSLQKSLADETLNPAESISSLKRRAGLKNKFGDRWLDMAIKFEDINAISIFLKHELYSKEEITSLYSLYVLSKLGQGSTNSPFISEMAELLEIGKDEAKTKERSLLQLAVVEKIDIQQLEAWIDESNANSELDYLGSLVTPLVFTINTIDNDTLKIVELLLEKKADPNKLVDDVSPLVAAIKNNNLLDDDVAIDIINLLLKFGAEINTTEGDNPLTVAIEEGNADVINLLVKNGADLDFTTNATTSTPRDLLLEKISDGELDKDDFTEIMAQEKHASTPPENEAELEEVSAEEKLKSLADAALQTDKAAIASKYLTPPSKSSPESGSINSPRPRKGDHTRS